MDNDTESFFEIRSNLYFRIVDLPVKDKMVLMLPALLFLISGRTS